MKKTVSILMMVVLLLMFLAGCGDPVYDDLQNFINVEMKSVNENYEKLKAEVSAWETLEENAALEKSIKDTLLPLAEDSLERLAQIHPETEEVQGLRNIYVQVMEAYNDGFSEILTGFQELDETKMTAGSEKLNKGMELLKEYNETLEKLAEEVGLEVEY